MPLKIILEGEKVCNGPHMATWEYDMVIDLNLIYVININSITYTMALARKAYS